MNVVRMAGPNLTQLVTMAVTAFARTPRITPPMTITITLYYSPGACSLASHIALKEIGVPHTLRRFTTAEKENYSPEYLAINPKARIPALEIDGFILTENAAILAYLGRRFPEAGLYPRNPGQDEARILEALVWHSNSVHTAFALIRRPERSSGDAATYPAINAHGQEEYRKALAQLDTLYARNEWAAGGKLSVADFYPFVFARWAKMIDIDVAKSYPNLARFCTKLAARPATQAALAAEGLTS